MVKNKRIRTFQILRREDISGVSGTGLVAEGVVFHDGQVAVSWYGRHHTIEIAPCIEDVIAIHGHSGATVLEWDNEPEL